MKGPRRPGSGGRHLPDGDGREPSPATESYPGRRQHYGSGPGSNPAAHGAEAVRLGYRTGPAFDCLVDKKLLRLAWAAVNGRRICRGPPRFVPKAGDMFTPQQIRKHPARIERERPERGMGAMDVCDPAPDTSPSPKHSRGTSGS